MEDRSKYMRERWSDPTFRIKMRQARWGEHVVPEFPQRHSTQLCACGCGEFVPLYNQTHPDRGIVKGAPAKFVRGHNSRGERHNQWRGGQARNGAGYHLRRLQKQRYQYEHRLVAEEILGRSLNYNEVVHHIDGDRENNDPSNLEVMSRADHMRLHMHGQEVSGIRLSEYTI